MRRLIIPSILLNYIFLSSPALQSQQIDTTDYFPLHVGDSWIKLSYEIAPYYYADTISVAGTKSICDTPYYFFNYKYGDSMYYRKDSIGNIYLLINTLEQLLYKVNADVGEHWNFIEKTTYDTTVFHYTISLEQKKIDVMTQAGLFHNSLLFLVYTTDLSDGSYYIWLAPGVGEVRRDYWGLGGYSSLKRAFINDNEISPHVYQIFNIYPSSGAENVDVSTNISFFLNTIPSITFADSNMSVISHKKGKVNGVWSNDWLFVFTPDQPFPELDTITVTLSARITDWFGDSLDGNFNWKYDGVPQDNFQWVFYTGIINRIHDDPLQPTEFQVFQNYPNPFNSSTILQYITPSRGMVKIGIYNILGQIIRTLASIEQESGRHEIAWDAKDYLGRTINSGVYLIRVSWNGNNRIIPTIYLK